MQSVGDGILFGRFQFSNPSVVRTFLGTLDPHLNGYVVLVVSHLNNLGKVLDFLREGLDRLFSFLDFFQDGDLLRSECLVAGLCVVWC